MKKKKTLAIIIIIFVFIAGICIWYFGFKKPHDKAFSDYSATVEEYNQKIPVYNDAVTEFNNAVQAVADENQRLEDAISKAQAVIDSGEPPYDNATLSSLSAIISSAQNGKISTPDSAELLQEIVVTEDDKKLNTNELKEKISNLSTQTQALEGNAQQLIASTSGIAKPDYTSTISEIQTAQKTLEDSITINKQIMNPSEDFVKNKLSTISSITEMQGVTEDNDPNGNLNKAGGYTSTVYFSVSLIDQSQVYGDTLIDKGTDAGGSIEVYSTVEDAEKRNTYLGAYDGSFLSSGSHTVLGTIVIRTSDKLTASQQKELESQIIACFTTL